MLTFFKEYYNNRSYSSCCFPWFIFDPTPFDLLKIVWIAFRFFNRINIEVSKRGSIQVKVLRLSPDSEVVLTVRYWTEASMASKRFQPSAWGEITKNGCSKKEKKDGFYAFHKAEKRRSCSIFLSHHEPTSRNYGAREKVGRRWKNWKPREYWIAYSHLRIVSSTFLIFFTPRTWKKPTLKFKARTLRRIVFVQCFSLLSPWDIFGCYNERAVKRFKVPWLDTTKTVTSRTHRHPDTCLQTAVIYEC